jgi:hypothetical protein
MINNTFVRKAVQVEYAILRTPLAAVSNQLGARLADDSKIRVSVEQGLQVLDAAASRLLRPAGPARSTGSATPAGDAAPKPQTEQPQPQPQAEEIERVAEVILDEQEQKPIAGELADPELDVAEVQAQLRAKHLLEEHAAQRGQQH